MMPLLLRYVVTEKSQAWMYEHHIDWSAWSCAMSRRLDRKAARVGRNGGAGDVVHQVDADYSPNRPEQPDSIGVD
jgi:hypothetical protein